MEDRRCAEILALLHREVKPALGCTEPVAVSLAVARAVEILTENSEGLCPEGWRLSADFQIDVAVSGNILKNGMGVGIPGTGMVGLPVAAALGAVCGDAKKGLEVLDGLTDAAVRRARELVAGKSVRIRVADTVHLLYVKATVSICGASASAVVSFAADDALATPPAVLSSQAVSPRHIKPISNAMSIRFILFLPYVLLSAEYPCVKRFSTAAKVSYHIIPPFSTDVTECSPFRV